MPRPKHELVNEALELLKQAGFLASPMMAPSDPDSLILRYDIPLSATVAA